MPIDVQSEPIPVACFAPPLTDELLAKYKKLTSDCLDPEVKDAMGKCLACVEKWWGLPVSKREGRGLKIFHRTNAADERKEIVVPVVPLETHHIQELDAVTPWMRELDTFSNGHDTGVFDHLPKGELRNAAFHLLWHAKELTCDREPMTLDKLKG